MEDVKNTRYAIIGAAGFLGQHVLHQLLEKNNHSEILLIDKASSLGAIKIMHPEDFASTRIKMHWGVDICETSSLNAILKDVDIVIHLAAAIAYGKKNSKILHDVNVRGSENVIVQAKKSGVKKIIYISSFATLGCLDSRDKSYVADEICPNRLDSESYSYYARSKYLGEQIAMRSASRDFKVIVAVPGIMFGPGPGHHASVLPFHIAMQNKVSVVPQGGTNIIDVRDAASALVALCDARHERGKYLLMAHNLEHKELMQKIADGADRPLKLITLPRFLAPIFGGIASIVEFFSSKHSPYSKEGLIKAFKYRYFSNDKTIRDLGWRPKYSIEQTIVDTFDWLHRGPSRVNLPRVICNGPSPVVITGASGFLGQHLTQELLDRGHEVYILTRDKQKTEKLFPREKVHIIEASLLNPDTLQLPKNAHIFHCAGITGSVRVSKKEYYTANVEGTKNLLEAAIKSHAQSFNFVSTISAVGALGKSNKPMTELTKAKPKTYYGMSKLAAENMLMAYPTSIPITIVRPPIIYGPGQSDRSGSAALFKLCQNKIIPKLGERDSIIPLVYVKNLAAGFVDLSFKNTGKEIFHLSDPVPYTLPILSKTIDGLCNKKSYFIDVPYLLGAVFGYSADLVSFISQRDLGLCSELINNIAAHGSHLSIDKALSLGYKPTVNLEEGLRITMSPNRR